MRHLDEGTLQAWLDRARSGLGDAEREEIERHLARCDTCARALDELDETTRTAGSLLAVEEAEREVPDYAAVVARTRERRGGRWRLGRWTAVAWAASVAAALAVGWLSNDLLRRGDGSPAAEGPRVADATPSTGPTSEPAPRRESDAAADRAAASTAESAQIQRPLPPLPEALPEADIALTSMSVEPAETLRPALPDSRELRIVLGRVTDEAGEPLAAAQVAVAGTGVGALTDQDGRFRLSIGEAATDSLDRDLTLTVQSLGYRPESRTVALGPGDTTIADDVRLTEEAIAPEEVVVTGAPVDTARSRERAAVRARTGVVVPPSPAPTGPTELVVPWRDPGPGGPWATVARADAEARAGFALLAVPDLPIVSIAVGEIDGVTVVRVVQALAEGAGELVLVEAQSPVGFDESARGEGRAIATTRRDAVAVAAAAPVPEEALRDLLGRLR
jgi:hypothetical protein